MSTTLVLEPDAFGLAKNINELVYRIQTDAYVVTPGTKFSAAVSLPGNPSNGETWILDCDLFPTQTFTFVNTPPLDCSEVFIGATAADTTQNLFNAVVSNYVLFENYDLLYLSGFTMEGKESGSSYDIIFTGTATVTEVTVPGVDEVVRDDLRIIASVWVETGADYVKALEFTLPIDENGEAEIDIYDILISYLSAFKPTFGYNDSELAPGPLTRYFLRYTDYYDDSYHCYHAGSVLRAVLAGYPEKDLFGHTFASDYFTDTNARKFLTRIPRGELRITKECPFYLYFWTTTNVQYRLGVTLYYTDGTSETKYDLKTRTTTNNLVCWPAGYDLLDLDNEKTAGKTVDRYEVFVINAASIGAATIKSEMFLIHVDSNYYLNKRFFMCLNSLGGMDVLEFTGVASLNQATEGIDYEISAPTHSEDTVNGELKMGIKNFTNPGTYFSGFKSKEYLRYLQELLKSELVYHMVDGKYREMRLLTTEAELYTDDSDQYGLSVEMVEAQINRGWS